MQSLNRKGLVHTQLISHRLSSGGFLRKETTTAKQKPLCLNWYRFKRPSLVLFQRPLTCVICEWSTQLFGPWPGIVSLIAWCWMPLILAHGSLVTSDVPAVVAALGAARCFWSFLLNPRPPTAMLSGALLGVAIATKYTLLILCPCWFCVLFYRYSRGHQFRQFAVLGCLMFSASIVTIDAFYLFQGVGFKLEILATGNSASSATLRSFASWPLFSWMLWIPLPLPIEFIRGLDFQLADVERSQAVYLLGEQRVGGWSFWYLIAAMVKVPIPIQALTWLAVVNIPSALSGNGFSRWAAICTIVPALEVTISIVLFTGTGTNASVRYLLPALALWCPWIGLALRPRTQVSKILVFGFVTWLGIGAFFESPDFLGWENELANVWCRDRPAILGDNTDWGQDIASLGVWAASRSPSERMIVCVYGMGDTRAYGLRRPAALAISAASDQCDYLAISENILFGNGTQNCVCVDGQMGVVSHELRKSLQLRRPFHRIGHSIRIFKLTSGDF
ncbi:glycosyltransferase family 39 protein [Schlesneria paludicola]|uniref:glycosyltransferase family 39 protein n=1 Tax=Schlesneria paludicola TaxID=360056 RepID=UPI0012F7D709|nr:glycosyltransferase family 39 protein [Schlesneria paludicola]